MIELKFHKTLQAPGGDFQLEVNHTFNKGDFITIYGPSGAGKTTLLRIIAGLIKPDRGSIKIGDKVWFDSIGSINLSPQKRSVGLVFQDYALFPNMTVKENIYYALGRDNFLKATDDIIQLMKLDSLLKRKPDTLSGGQKQRVALARSLVQLPEILLLDEPMAALDIEMRSNIQNYLLEAHKTYNLTTILVSHDIGEIFKMSNHVVKIENGQIVQQGEPADVFMTSKLASHFQFNGEVLNIAKDDTSYLLTILIDSQMVKVSVDESVAMNLSVGDRVLVSTKTFNPIVQKMH